MLITDDDCTTSGPGRHRVHTTLSTEIVTNGNSWELGTHRVHIILSTEIVTNGNSWELGTHRVNIILLTEIVTNGNSWELGTHRQASNLTAAPRKFAAMPWWLATMPREWNSSIRPLLAVPCFTYKQGNFEHTPCLFQMMKWRPVIFYLARLESGATLDPRDCAQSYARFPYFII